MTTQPKLIIAPIKITGELSPQYMMLDVYITTDTMQEINLISVLNHFNKKELVYQMDSVSKQRVLHNLFAQ